MATKQKDGAVTAATALIFILCGIAVIPGLGFSVWLIAIPCLFVLFVLSIVVLAKGHVGDGLIILIMSIAGVPLWVAFAPIISTAIFARISENEAKAPAVSSEAPAKDTTTAIPPAATPAPKPKSASLARSVGVQTDYGLLQIRAGTPVKIVSESPRGLTIDVSGQRITVERNALAFE